MKIFFIQEFTNQLKIFHVVGKDKKIDKHQIRLPIDAEEVIRSVTRRVKDETLIEEIVLKGKSGTLNKLAKYYGERGVDITWQ